MAFRDFLDKLKQKAEDRLNPKPLTPEQEREQKKAAARKQFEQLNSAIEFGKKAMKIKKGVDEKVDAVKDGLAQKTIDIVGKIGGDAPAAPKQEKPAAPKKPGVIAKTIDAAGSKVKDIAQAQRDAADRKPSTRSGILDLIVPAVPDTKATAPKKLANDTPKSKTPRTHKPK